MNIPSVIKSGYDTWVDLNHPNKRRGSKDWIRLNSTYARGMLWMPVPGRIEGRTVESATLTGHAHRSLSAQTITFTPLSGKWHAKTATWNNQPGTIGSAVSTILTALADRAEFAINVTPLVQQIADGQTNYGWRITTNVASDQKFATFNSGLASWRLDISYVDGPDAPTNLSPNGTVVSVPEPIATFDYTTFGGDDSDLAKINLQIDKGNNGTIDMTSGWLPTTIPQYSLASSLTIAAGDTVAYRFQVQDAGGQQSDWSDWATYTYRPLPTLTLDSPAAGVLYDPTSDVLAHISTLNLESFKVRVADGDDRTSIRYDSRKQPADSTSSIAWGLPLKNDDGSRIFTDDQNFQINVRAYDNYEREATPDSKTFVELWTTVHFDDDAALSPVSTFEAAQVDNGPVVKLTWTDAAAPDSYVISRSPTQNVIVNPGFENGVTPHAAVNDTDIAIATNVPHTGANALVIGNVPTRASEVYSVFACFNGPFRDTTTALPVVEGDVIHGQAWFRNNSAAGSQWRVQLRTLDAAGNDLTNFAGNEVVVSSSYQLSAVDYTIPAGAAYVQLVVIGANTTAGASILVDDAYMSKNRQPTPQLFKVDPADVVVGTSTYSMYDTTATPGVPLTYSIRRITHGVGRSVPFTTELTVSTEGIWLLRDNGDSVVVDGDGIDQMAASERRIVFKPINLPYDVDILTAYEGISGPVTGSIEDDDDRTLARARAVLDAIKANPTEVVRIAYATVNKPVNISQMDVQPDPEWRTDMNRHVVRFIAKQAGEFDFRVS